MITCLLLSIDDEPEYDVFKFDDVCSIAGCLISSAFGSISPLASLELKPLPDSLKHSFLGMMNLYLLLLLLT